MKTQKRLGMIASLVLACTAIGCMETPTQGTSIGTPGHNITFSGYLTVPNETVRIEYRTWNGVWNNLVTTNSSAVASGMGRYEWIVEAQVPDAGWAATKIELMIELVRCTASL